MYVWSMFSAHVLEKDSADTWNCGQWWEHFPNVCVPPECPPAWCCFPKCPCITYFLEITARAAPSCHKGAVTSSAIRWVAFAWCEDRILSKELFSVTYLISFDIGYKYWPWYFCAIYCSFGECLWLVKYLCLFFFLTLFFRTENMFFCEQLRSELEQFWLLLQQ